jgi:ABC-type branched-subunit amino acid transport system substrate-binding protein
MVKMTLAKTIEAQKLNPRTLVPTTEPPVTVPYGAIITQVEQVGDVDNFMYLGAWHQCAHGVLQAAAEQAPVAAPAEAAPSAAAPAEANLGAVAAPVPTAGLQWETLASDWSEVRRARVRGGWLVTASGGVAFLPDPEHAWQGGSV